MYCRKCMKKSGEKEKKVNMNVELDERCYICPECGHIVEWDKEER